MDAGGTPMQAVILAAGVGRRLRQAAGGRPKSLLRFNGRSLLERHVANLERCGVESAHIVTGYRHETITAAVAGLRHNIRVRTLRNPEYNHGSVVSLQSAAAVLESGADIVLMDADVLYHPDILARLLASRHRNCLLLDENFEPGEEPVKILVADGRIVEFRKKIGDNAVANPAARTLRGESVGFFRFEPDMAALLSECARGYLDGRRHAPHEEAIRDLILPRAERFGYENISGLPWIEIDFPADIAKAERIAVEQLEETE